MALLLLTLGCVLVTDLRSRKPHAKESGSRLIGLFAVGAAALLSSSSSVYFEKMLKRRAGAAQQQARRLLDRIGGDREENSSRQPSPSAANPSPHPRQAGLWLRNIQLGMFALPLAAAGMAYQDCTVYTLHAHCISPPGPRAVAPLSLSYTP